MAVKNSTPPFLLLACAILLLSSTVFAGIFSGDTYVILKKDGNTSLPSQGGHAGMCLKTDGNNLSWGLCNGSAQGVPYSVQYNNFGYLSGDSVFLWNFEDQTLGVGGFGSNLYQGMYTAGGYETNGNFSGKCIKLAGDSTPWCSKPSGGSGNPFDQNLNTTDTPVFATVSAGVMAASTFSGGTYYGDGSHLTGISGGSQSPWTSDINAANHGLYNLDNIDQKFIFNNIGSLQGQKIVVNTDTSGMAFRDTSNDNVVTIGNIAADGTITNHLDLDGSAGFANDKVTVSSDGNLTGQCIQLKNDSTPWCNKPSAGTDTNTQTVGWTDANGNYKIDLNMGGHVIKNTINISGATFGLKNWRRGTGYPDDDGTGNWTCGGECKFLTELKIGYRVMDASGGQYYNVTRIDSNNSLQLDAPSYAMEDGFAYTKYTFAQFSLDGNLTYAIYEDGSVYNAGYGSNISGLNVTKASGGTQISIPLGGFSYFGGYMPDNPSNTFPFLGYASGANVWLTGSKAGDTVYVNRGGGMDFGNIYTDLRIASEVVSMPHTNTTLTGYGMCYYSADGNIGHCTTAIGSNGKCTCVAN